MTTQRVSETGALTAIHLSIIAVIAILTVIAIIWGARLKRQRQRADEVEADRIEALGGTVPGPEEAAKPLEEPSATTSATAKDHDAVATPKATTPDTVTRPEPTRAATPVAVDQRDDAPAPVADTPIAAAAPLDATPASEAQPASAPPETAPVAERSQSLADDPVTRLKGLGPKVAERLKEQGITTVGQLAALDATGAEQLDARLGPFTGRMVRDRWIEQARFLTAGDRAGFEAVFGKL